MNNPYATSYSSAAAGYDPSEAQSYDPQYADPSQTQQTYEQTYEQTYDPNANPNAQYYDPTTSQHPPYDPSHQQQAQTYDQTYTQNQYPDQQQNAQQYIDPTTGQPIYDPYIDPNAAQYNEVQQQVEKGTYVEYHRFLPQLRFQSVGPVTSLAFDSSPSAVNPSGPFPSNLLFCGSSQMSLRGKGAGSERSFTKMSMLAAHRLPNCEIHSAIPAHSETPPPTLDRLISAKKNDFTTPPSSPTPHSPRPDHVSTVGISAILTSPPMVISLSGSGIRAHSRGMNVICSNSELIGYSSACFNPANEQYGHGSVTQITCGSPLSNELSHLDLYSGLREISRPGAGDYVTSVKSGGGVGGGYILAGCRDGSVKVMDGGLRSSKKRYEQKISAHNGPVKGIAVSADGTMVCTIGSTGSGKRSYADNNVMTFDIRMVGRPPVVTQFLAGGPGFLDFLEGEISPTLVVASSKPNGSVQIFEPLGDPTYAQYLQPSLSHGEAFSSMAISPSTSYLAFGTTHSSVILMERFGHEKAVNLPAQLGEDVSVPVFPPAPPQLSIPPTTLCNNSGSPTNPFNMYALRTYPTLSDLGEGEDQPENQNRPQRFFTEKCVGGKPHKKTLSNKLSDLKSEQVKNAHDFVSHVRASVLDLPSLPANSNFNRFVFDSARGKKVYSLNCDPRNVTSNDRRVSSANKIIPEVYHKPHRPTSGPSQFSFSYSNFNKELIFPGWDCNLPNDYANSVLLVLYFIPEIRASCLREQFEERIFKEGDSKNGAPKEGALSAELGFLFHQIDQLSNHSYTNTNPDIPAFSPSNFLSTFSLLPEAAALALLDGSPSAVKLPRRIEALYRFLLHHLSTELTPPPDMKDVSVIDDLMGFDFGVKNDFVAGGEAEKGKGFRAMTIELSYLSFRAPATPSFSALLQTTLHRETRLRAWHAANKKYELIIQKRVVKNLPRVLNLQCTVAGNDDGMEYWRQSNKKGGLWVPRRVEVELLEDGGVRVSELLEGEDGTTEWQVEGGSGDSKVVSKKKYELISTVSYIKNYDDGKMDFTGHHVSHIFVPPSNARKVKERQISEVKALIEEQEIENVTSSVGEKLNFDGEGGEKAGEGGAGGGLMGVATSKKITLASQVSMKALKEREAQLQADLDSDMTGGWSRWNCFRVEQVDAVEARDYSKDYREPCLLVFREMEEEEPSSGKKKGKKEAQNALMSPDMIRLTEPGTLTIPLSVMTASPVNNVTPTIDFGIDRLPGKGDIVAIDSEFVSVQHEDSHVDMDGGKVVNMEGRSALARVSIVDSFGRVLLDDYVLPQEPVVDYVTRFSGIVASDLDPLTSNRHLVTMRTAYLKLRLLIDRGVVFIGHGLETDFKQLNVFVPPRQIIDTVHIFSQPRARKIGLRFLVNYLIGHDLQAETHDSIDDARAALELYAKALELKKEGDFDKQLTKIYEHGRKVGWTVGLSSEQK